MRRRIINKSYIFKVTYCSNYNKILSLKEKSKHIRNQEILIRCCFLTGRSSHYQSNSQWCHMLWFTITVAKGSLKVFCVFVTRMTQMEARGDTEGQMMRFELSEILQFPFCKLWFSTCIVTITSSPCLLSYTCTKPWYCCTKFLSTKRMCTEFFQVHTAVNKSHLNRIKTKPNHQTK